MEAPIWKPLRWFRFSIAMGYARSTVRTLEGSFGREQLSSWSKLAVKLAIERRAKKPHAQSACRIYTASIEVARS